MAETAKKKATCDNPYSIPENAIGGPRRPCPCAQDFSPLARVLEED